MGPHSSRREAAYTKLDPIYPGFINVIREGDAFTVTLRGDARDGTCGPQVSLELTDSEWQIFVAEISHRLYMA